MRPPAPEPTSERATRAQQLAGGLMLANAALVVLEAALMPSGPASKTLFQPGTMVLPAAFDVLPAAFDIAIGISLLMRSRRFLTWAIVRVVVGLVFLTALQATQGPVPAVLQLVLSSSLLLLLVGNAGMPRMAVGGTLFGLYALVGVVVLGAIVTGRNPIASVLQRMSGTSEPIPGGVVTGNSAHYRLHVPSEKWLLRKDEVVKKENPLADHWLTRPDLDAHVIVIAEKVPGVRVMPDATTDRVLSNSKRGMSAFELVRREPLRTLPQSGRLLHTRSTASGLQVEALSGVVAVYEHGYQIIAFAPRAAFAEVEQELRGIIESFELPTDEHPGLPAGVEPAPVSRVEGLSQAYGLTAPGEGWYLRQDEVAKKDNELADRWLVRPEEDAHIVVVAERAPGVVLDVERYADAVESIIKKNPQSVIESREPLKEHPGTGRLLHVKATVSGLPIEYYYGLFARGDRAFQVLAFAHQDTFPRLADGFMKAINSFEMPHG